MLIDSPCLPRHPAVAYLFLVRSCRELGSISAIGQIVGAFAVVISLIYVASEVRRNTRATQLAAMRSMHDAFNRWIQQLTERPDVRELYYRGIHDFDSLKGADLVGFSTS